MKNTELIRQRIQKIVIMSGLSKAKFANSIGFDCGYCKGAICYL